MRRTHRMLDDEPPPPQNQPSIVVEQTEARGVKGGHNSGHTVEDAATNTTLGSVAIN